MHKTNTNPCRENQEIRKYVAELVLKVSEGKLYVREALEKFPCDIKDDSVRCAWHALVHYEADDELKKNDIEYAEEQNNFLEEIAHTLQKGEPLPENILREYNDYYGIIVNAKTNSFLSKIKSIFRFIA